MRNANKESSSNHSLANPTFVIVAAVAGFLLDVAVALVGGAVPRIPGSKHLEARADSSWRH